MKKLILVTSFFLSLFHYSSAQEFLMGDGSFVTCSGNFLDSGGVSGNYSNAEDSVITFCSPFPTDKIQVTFNSFALSSGDLLFIYDGDSVTAPIVGVFVANNSPGIRLASAANTSGCLTFRFRSDGSNNAAGWNANIACIDNCQSITGSVTSLPAPDVDGILRICQGETVNYAGTGNFSVDGSNATYKYILSDGTEVAGTTASETYNTPGIYKVDFVVGDGTGCRDRQLEDVVILVSTDPDFTGTAASQTDICFGDQVTLMGNVQTTQYIADVAPPITGQTFLPDGNGISYQTCINVTGFPNGRTFQSVSDLQSFFINMEHSFLGDLDMNLTAPNGSVINIKTGVFAGGGTYLGIPIDIDTDLSPGVGFIYTFTEAATATQTFVQAAATNTTLPAGDYRCEDPFANFIGTPLNGLWCLNITDNLGSDNGYIFEWGINFNPAIIPTAGSYQPGEVVEMWQASADIISTTGSDIVVQPSQIGQNCYVFELTDDFGCTYSETVCVNVAAEITSLQPDPIIVCQTTGSAIVDLTSRNVQILNGLSASNYSITYYNSQLDADSQTGVIQNPTSFPVTTATALFARIDDNSSACYAVEEIDIEYSVAMYNSVNDIELCDDLNANGIEVFDLTGQIAGILGMQDPADYEVRFFETQQAANDNMGAIATPAAYTNTVNPQTIYVRVSNVADQDCFATGTFQVRVLALPQIGAGVNLSECDDSPIDNATVFNLSVNDAAILAGQSSASYTITYHDNEQDANTGAGALNQNAATLTNGATVYARISDNITGCYNVSTFITTVELCEVTVPEGFSPNNDGVNDTFSIPGLEQYANFELSIFNRLGTKLFETRGSNYEEFAGIPNRGLGAGDGLLPVGTYFYVLKFNDGVTKDISSWVYISY